MADSVLIDIKIASLEKSLEETAADVSTHDDLLDSHSDRILSIEHWRNGNGAKGAEARLQAVECETTELRECLGASKTEEAIERIASVAALSIVKNARGRDRTAVEKVKAFAPYFAAALLAVTTILQAVL